MRELDQQIAIAEWCGWKKCKGDCFQGQFERKDEPGFVFDIHHIPDYLHDLNAMHEAEKRLTTEQQVSYYEDHLRMICGSYRCALNSTARQRAEALLRTIGKWKDE